MFEFCTYFDRNYLVKGLTLYRSLEAMDRPFRLWVLAFDDETHEVLDQLALEHLCVIPLEEFEFGDPDLAAVKPSRSRVEYYFTCTPSLPLYVLRADPRIEVVTYLDADLYCFSDPQPVLDELGSGSTLITPHRFPATLQHMENYGKYNVGVVAFRNDRAGLDCLTWWRERCLEWCYDRLEDERFGDQKYLDEFPERFENVIVSRQPGVNAAPWNWMSYPIGSRAGGVTVDGAPLIFYHFHQLRQINSWICDPGISSYGGSSRDLRRLVYQPYIRQLKHTWAWLRAATPLAGPGYTRPGNARDSNRKLLGDLVRSAVRGQLILTPGRGL